MREHFRAGALPPGARAFTTLQADEALLPAEASALKRSSALFLALMVLAAVPLFWAANAAGIVGDLPAAVAKSNSGPDGGEEEEHRGSGDGDGEDNHTGPTLGTDQTSANGAETAGTTNDQDTHTAGPSTDDTSGARETRGTTNDDDTQTAGPETDDTSGARETRGTTNDDDTQTAGPETDDTSADGGDTRGTTNDQDTRTQAGV